MSLVGVAFQASVTRADGFSITSFPGNGRLVFNTLDDGTNYQYRVEWASSLNDDWKSFGEAAAALDRISGAPGNSVTSTVPMFFRVVAMASQDYLCIDLSGGPLAESYPVTYYGRLQDVPGGANSDLYKTDKLLMRRIVPAGFTMGSPPAELGRHTDEDQHAVTLSDSYYIGLFEVTQRHWELVMANRPSYFANSACYETRPVEQVTYHTIRENPANTPLATNWPASSAVHSNSFIGKLRSRTGLAALDLPTEAQWEYACRAGTTTALNSGKDLTGTETDANVAEVGRYWYNGGNISSPSVDTSGGSAKVGSYLPNAWGLYDMHANVWEWCLDWFGSYSGSGSDPKGAETGSWRVLRGGSLNDNALRCRSANRNDYGYAPNQANQLIGFRIACPHVE